MTRNSLIFFLLLPFCTYSKNYKTEIDSINSKASQYINVDLDSSYILAVQAIEKSKKHFYLEGEMEGQYQKGRVLFDQARRTLSLQAGELSLAIAEEINNYNGKKNALNLIGKIQNHSKQYAKGIKTVRKNLKLAKLENDSVTMALMTNFLGIFKNKLGEKDSSLYFTMQSIKINKKLNAKKALAYNYNSLGIHHYEKRTLDSCYYYFRKALKIRTDLKLPNQSIEAYNNLGYVFLLEKLPDSAIVYFQKCIQLCLKYEKKSNLAVAYKNIADAYELTDNYRLALAAIKKSIPINDSLIGIKQKEQIISEQKQKNNELQILQAYNKEQKKKQYILIILLVFTLLSTIYLLKKTKQRAIDKLYEKEKINAAKIIIQEQEKIREEIAQELHDGIGGSLAGLKLSLSNLQNESKCPKLFSEITSLEYIYQEIRDISHNLMPVYFYTEKFQVTIDNYLNRMFPNLKIGICFQCYPEEEISKLNYNKKIYIYRIIQELATNIQRHALASNVNFHLTGHKDQITIMAEDDGIGFDKDKIVRGIGLNNIKRRVTIYDGKMKVDTKVGSGTTIIIDIPNKIL
tara:strand:+ start:1037 stop:2758 length:1722 start_codon:yes stop_codon:yes gene_type:complete